MQPYYPTTIREEELKNRVAADFFGSYDCTRIVGNIDFCVSTKRKITIEGDTIVLVNLGMRVILR